MTTSRPAIIEITADSRSLGARLREASGKLASFAASSARVVGRYGGATAATLGGPFTDPRFYKGLGRLAKGGAMAAGAALVVSAGKVRDFEEGLIRLQINADATGDQMDRMRRSVRAASSETALGSQEILDGVSKYVDLTGDFDGASKSVRQFARVAQASNSDVGDVAASAAALRDALKIKPEEMEAAFSALVVQGKKGSITMRQMGAELAQVAPVMGQFKGGTGLGGLRELGAALQIINKRYNDAAESRTAFNSLAVALQSRSDKLEKANVHVFDVGPDGVKRLKDFYEIVDAIGRSKLMKDPRLLYKTLGRAEAIAPLQQLIRLRQERDALRDAGDDTGAIDRDLKTYQGSKVGKLAKHWNDTKEMGQSLAEGAIDLTERTVGGLSAGFSGEAERMYAQEAQLKSDEGVRRRGALQVMMRYAARGLTIDPQQAEGVNAIETAQQWNDTLAGWGGTATTQAERDNLRKFSMAPQADGSQAGVDAAGNVSSISAYGLAQMLQIAMTNALRDSGLSGPLKVGADAVAGAAKSAPSIRRRP